MIYLQAYLTKLYPILWKYLKKGHSGFGVNVYDNGKLLEGSPFSSYTQAALALGNVSSAISKKNRYWQAL